MFMTRMGTVLAVSEMRWEMVDGKEIHRRKAIRHIMQ